ncbi:MAG: ATP-dependent DNA helicase [Acidimicrobiales bacterium]|nr:ATP-dependent DNA helicase [Acidimicrobiales bacterium]
MSFTDLTISSLEAVTAALPGGGERRVGQADMARSVATAIESDGHLVVQAGTGTGKSLAYLVPAVLSDRPTIIATATKALQDQLAGKDLPFLAEQLDVSFTFAMLKGRSNYLCLQRLDELEADGRLDLDLESDEDDKTSGSVDSETLVKLRTFAAETDVGDRAELEWVSDRVWRQVSVGRDECPGAGRCPQGDACLAEKARRKANSADILVVNLHLYALAIMVDTILPEHDVVIIDEAHQLEDIVAEAAGRQISPARVQSAARNAQSVLVERNAPEAAEAAAVALHVALEGHIGDRLTDGPDEVLGRALDDVRGATERLLNALRAVPDDAPADTRTKAIRARQVATSLVDDIDAVRWPTETEVMWVDGPSSNPGLRSTPISIAKLLSENLWDKRAGVLTSATLPTNATSQLGLPESAITLDVGSPFDYSTNTLLFCPTHLPDPRSSDFRAAQHDEIELLIAAAGGGTLALFTSFSAMREAVDRLETRLPWPILMQGDKAKNALLQEFVENDETSLFATMSFWQGIDAPGRTCRLVIIDRLPFPRPNDPVLQARRDRVGKAAFRLIDLPRAATLLAQGAGRLIRTSTDQGVVAVLDPRLATARTYRWDLINALPPMTRTKERDEATSLLQRLRDQP